MRTPEPKPVTEHLSEWSRPDLANAAEAVKSLVETDGWKAVQRSIEDRLRFEQRVMMIHGASGEDDQTRARYERTIGQWAGLREVGAIAEGLVRAGEQAEREMRDPDTAEAA